MKRYAIYSSTFLLVATLVCSCSLFPVQTFSEKYAAGVTTLQGAITTTDQLLTAGKITKADAQNVEKQIDVAKEALDLAQSIYATDQTTGANKLASALTALQGISTYLQQKGK